MYINRKTRCKGEMYTKIGCVTASNWCLKVEMRWQLFARLLTCGMTSLRMYDVRNGAEHCVMMTNVWHAASQLYR